MPTTKKKHPAISATLHAEHTKEGALTPEKCKELIGWIEEPENANWGKDFVFKDVLNQKIRLLNNPSNRPFKRALADRYANEHLRGKWALNLETVVIDANGKVPQGQHRLVGFILAEQMRQDDLEKWGTSPLLFEVLVGYGVSPKPETANTYDLGTKRSLGDVIYRHQKFAKGVPDKKQRGIAKTLAGAIRLVWIRAETGGAVSFAPHFPHSEALEFYANHPKILDAVGVITTLDDTEKNISSLLSLSYASALFFLQANATSWKKAEEFWTAFESGEDMKKGNPILTLCKCLTNMEASSGSKRDAIIGMCIKAWLLWVANKKTNSAIDIKVKRRKQDDKFVLAEFPRIGGIDSAVEVEKELDAHQLRILAVLKTAGKPVTYADLKKETNLRQGTLTTAIMDETKAGKANPFSLVTRGHIKVQMFEPETGEKEHFVFSLNGK